MEVTSKHIETLAQIREFAGWPQPLDGFPTTELAGINYAFGTFAVTELAAAGLVTLDQTPEEPTLSFTLAGKTAEATYSTAFEAEQAANRRVYLTHGFMAEPEGKNNRWRLYLSEDDQTGFPLSAYVPADALDTIADAMHHFFEAGYERGEHAGSAKTRKAVEEVASMIFAPLIDPLAELVSRR